MAALPVWAIEPTAQELQQIKTKLAALDTAFEALRAAKVDDDLIVDAEVAKHAVELALRFPEEFTDQGKIRQALSALDHGLQRANQLREAIAASPVIAGKVEQSITISMGIAVSECIGAKEVEPLVSRADAALYTAKHKGRNRVEYIVSSAAQAPSKGGEE